MNPRLFRHLIFALGTAAHSANVNAMTLVGADVGLSIARGQGLRDINQRLGDSQTLRLKSKHGFAPRAALSIESDMQNFSWFFQTSAFFDRDALSANGLGSKLVSTLTQTGFDLGVMRDLKDTIRMREGLARLGLSPADFGFALGVNAGISSLTHDLAMSSRLDSSSVSYNLSQLRAHIGPQLLFRYRVHRQLSLQLNLKSVFATPRESELHIRQFVVAGSDLSQIAKDQGLDKLAPRQYMQNSATLGIRYRIE